MFGKSCPLAHTLFLRACPDTNIIHQQAAAGQVDQGHRSMCSGERRGTRWGPLLLLMVGLASFVPSSCQAAGGPNTKIDIQSSTNKAAEEAAAAECVSMFWPAKGSPRFKKSIIKHTAQRMRGGRTIPPIGVLTPQVSVEVQGAGKKRTKKPVKSDYDSPHKAPKSYHKDPEHRSPYEAHDKPSYDGPGPNDNYNRGPPSRQYRDYPDFDYYGPGQEPYRYEEGPFNKPRSNGIQQSDAFYLNIDNSRQGGPGVTLESNPFAEGSDDGMYGDWRSAVSLERDFVPVDGRPFFTVTGPEEATCDTHECALETRITMWGKFYELTATTAISAEGLYPPPFVYDVRPTRCWYITPKGVEFHGQITNISPMVGEATITELADGSWAAGRSVKFVCDIATTNLRLATPGRNSTERVTEAKASACVDMLWPNAPSRVRQARIRQAMRIKGAAPVPTQLAEYQPDGPGNPYQYGYGPTPKPYIGGTPSSTYVPKVYIMYTGSAKDKDDLDTAKTGAWLEQYYTGEFEADGNGGLSTTVGYVEGDQGVPIIPARRDRRFVHIEGPASHPESVTIWGELSGWRSGIPEHTPLGSWQAYTYLNVHGYVPQSLTFDLSLEGFECAYINPCGNKLSGSLVIAPDFGRHNVYELLNWEWLPKSVVRFVCEIDAGQTTHCAP